ncbi:MAG: hypothetical protein ABFR75_14290 [Acidobacteriota bacterium]
MKNNLIKLTIFLFVFTIIPFSAFTQENNPEFGIIQGFVYAKDLKTPVRRAQIVLKEIVDKKSNITPKVYQSNITGKTGSYQILDIEQGNYKVTIKLKNNLYKVKKIDFLITVLKGKTSYISFSLRKKALPPIAWVITGTAICRSLCTILDQCEEASPTTR